MSSTFIFVPFMITSPPLWPGLQGPIHVDVIVISGAASGGERITIVYFELKSPVISARVVVFTPGRSSQVVTLCQDPSGLWFICPGWQFFRDT